MSVPEREGVSRPVAVMICGLVYLCCLSIFLPYLPTAAGTVGHDYALHFPNLLAGFYWGLQNGFGSIPWFSPAQCGGFPYFPDPNVAYVSMPQLLVFAVSPMRAVQLTFALFALIGLLGAYALMRHGFRSSRAAAVLAAGLFVFNGFFAYRLLIGHLTFHAFALTPLMVVALLPTPLGRDTWAAVSVRVCVAGACLAYMFQSGMIHGIPPVLLATTVVLLIHGLCFGWRWQPWLLLGAAGVLSLMLCAGKLVAELSLLSNFPRDQYPLPGIPGLPTLLRMVAQALFLSPPADALDRIVNTQWLLERSEWEYGVSVVPGLLIVASVLIALVRRREQAPLAGVQIAALSVILILLAAPIAVNWYQSAWNGILKSLPYIGSSSSLLRLFSAYILVVIVVGCLVFDRLPLPRVSRPSIQLALVAVGLGVVVLQNALTDRTYYADQRYRVAPVEAEYARARATRTIRPIDAIVDRGAQTVDVNNPMTDGGSQIACYQPILGYRLEKFPVAPLQLGPVDTPLGGVINLKNPACYLFGAENRCRPGDHFTIAQSAQAMALRTYRPIAFEQPFRQKLATSVSLLSLIGLVLLLAVSSLYLVRRAGPSK